jgi:hypothetical protein
MKKLLFLLAIFAVSSNITAQFTKNIISNTNTNGAYGVLEKDLDDDGDLDLMSASQVDNTIAYYINDGSGNFTQHIVTNSLSGASFVDAADFDNDGDMDFVGLGTSDLAWYENNNGTFTTHSIETGLNEPYQVRLYDVGTLTNPNPDGDIDIGLLISGDNNATIYFNDGSNQFSRYNIISVNSPRYLYGGDFNSDNTDDFVITSYNTNEIKWYKLGSWSIVVGGTVTTGFSGAFGVESGDIDLDGDDDVIATAYLGNEVAWFENTDGTGNTFTKHTIDNNLPGASYIHWDDIDNDGDKDIIVSAYGELSGGTVINSQMVIYYNDGNQSFTKTVIDDIESGMATFSVQDFDGDNAKDIVFAAGISNKLVLMATSTNAIDDITANTQFTAYPNPTNQFINISAKHAVSSVFVFDITGRKVLQNNTTKLDIAHLPAGNYLLQVHLENGSIDTQQIIIKH